MQTTIDKMKLDAETAKAKNDLRFDNVNKTALLQEALEEAGAVRSNAKLLLRSISLEGIELKDGKIKDIETLLKPVMEEHKTLFGKPILKGNDPTIPEGAPEGYITKDKFMAMTTKERAANITKVNESSPHWAKK